MTDDGRAITALRFGVLGPLEVVDGSGAQAVIGGPRLRVLLTALLLDAGRVVTGERLIDDLWEGDAPSGAVNALQSLVSRLRRGLPDGCGRLIESHQVGYRLAVDPGCVDAHRFTELAGQGRRELESGDAAAAAATLRAALDLWRGPAFADAAGHEFARAAAARYEQARGACVEDRVEADLRLGRAAELVPELEALVAAEPLSERRRGQLMRALYGAGRQADALATYDETRRVLADELGVDPSPELEKLHLSVLRHDPSLAVPEPVPPSASALTGNGPSGRTARTPLPTPLTSFVGRDREVMGIADALKNTRLITLTGPGGAGKTRLAGEVGTLAAERVPDAVWFVPLGPLRDPAEVPYAMLAALGLRERALVPAGLTMPPPSADATERIVAALRATVGLIVLDNCEHVVGAAAELVDRVLAECPRLRVLATSREALGITGERLWPVPPLGMPPPGVTSEHAREYPSVRLLAERAQAVRPGFTIDDTNVAAVTTICRSLDGMPLAIELAAARMRSMSPAQVADRLGDRFRLLTAGSRTALPRHQTLRAVVEWSWELLTEPERTLARRLSVFSGGAPLTAVERVCSGEGLAEHDVIDALAGLVDKSLVEMDPDGDEVRYRMLETVRAYGGERLAAAGEDGPVGAAHTRHYLELITDAEPRLRTAEQLRWLALYDAEYGNIAAALHRSVTRGDTESALRLLAGSCWYLMVRGRGTEFRTWAAQVREVAGPESPPGLAGPYALVLFAALGDDDRPFAAVDEEDGTDAFRAGFQRINRMREAAPGEFTWPVFRLLDLLGPIFERDSEAVRAAALRMADDPDPWISATSGLSLGLLRANFGEMPAAETTFERGIARVRALGERFALAHALAAYSEPLTTRGAHDEAIAALSEAARISAELAGRTDSHMHARLAYLRLRAGDRTGARAEIDRWRDALSGEESPTETLYGDFVRTELARHSGDLAAARDLLATTRARLGEPRGSGPEQMMRGLLDVAEAGLALAEGDTASCLRAAETAVRHMVTEPVHDMPMAATAVEALAAATLAAGDAGRAAELLGCTEASRGLLDTGSPDVRETIAAARTALGEGPYEEAVARGREMTPADVRASLPDA